MIHGAVQKGPFVLGSTVSISATDTTGAPTGQVYDTQTIDSLGDFRVSFAYRGYTDMQAQGFYYDEVTGALSGAPVVLRALYDVKSGGNQSAYINMITHLAHDRAIALMGDGGATLEAAEAQAETELATALGIGGSGFQPGGMGVQLNEVGTNSVPNAYLFAVSAVLVQVAIARGGSVDAQLQQLLDTIASDLASGGQLPASVSSEILAAETSVDIDGVTDFFSNYLAATGSTSTPATLNLAIDSDGDGYRNSIDTCPLVANSNQSQIPNGVLCDVTRRTSFFPPSSGTPRCLILGDFAKTGFADLVACGLSGSPLSVTLSLGDGTGRFAPPVNVSLPSGFTPMLAFDVNKDGKLDLAGAQGWVAGDGTGHFGSLAPYYSGAAFNRSVVLGDFNRDGIPDVVGLDSNGVLWIALASSPGSFGPPTEISGSGGTQLAIADVNGDTNPDVVDFGLGSGIVVSLLGNGAGGFVGSPFATLSGPQYGLADFDGDGILDAAGWSNSGGMAIAFGDGNGGFGARAEDASFAPGAVAPADFNGDGKADLWIVGNSGSSCTPTVQVMLSTGPGFAPPQSFHDTPYNSATPCPVPVDLITGNLNGDGTPDVVVAATASTNNQATVQGFVIGECPGCTCAGTMCAGACTNLDADVANCGTCGHACSGGAICQNGSCVCPGSATSCNGECVNTTTNNANCNGCGKACTDGAICRNGSCGCPASEILCNGTCVDPMTNDQNCGGCGKACTAPSPSTALCTAGKCQLTLAASGLVVPYGIAIDATNVYFTDPQAHGVYKVPISGGPSTLLAGASTSTPVDVAVDSTRVYWTDQSMYALMAVPIAGGTATTLYSGTNSFVRGLAVNSTNVYWTSFSQLLSQPTGGGATATVVSAGDVLDQLTSPQGIALDSANAYYFDWSSRTVNKVPLGGGSATPLATAYDPTCVATDGTNVYWTDTFNGTVMRVPVAGGSATTLAGQSSYPMGLAVDNANVYWADQNGYAILKVPVGGGAPVTIAKTPAGVYGVAVDSTSVYWTEGGAVMKLTPK
jgi:hypothetical protein